MRLRDAGPSGGHLAPTASAEDAGPLGPETRLALSLRVLLVTGIFPPDIGGPATYVPAISAGLATRSHDVTVLTVSDGSNHDDSAFPYQVVRLARRGPRLWKWLRTVAAIVGRGRTADVLFVNGLAKEAALANLVLRKPMVTKIVGDAAWETATIRGWTSDEFDVFQRVRHGLRVEALKWLRRWWARRADRIVANSRYTSRWVERWGIPIERIEVVHNSVEDVGDVEPARLPVEAPVKLVTVCRLVPWKGVAEVVEAIAGIEGVGLAIVGDGPEKARLEALAKSAGAADRVYFAGRRNRPAMLALVASADIFVLNSSWESFAHVLLEAMALGIPVIATAIGGPMEIVEDGRSGIFVGPEHRTLSDAIRTLAEDPELRRQMGERGKVVARERFGVEKMVRRTEQVLLDAVATSGN